MKSKETFFEWMIALICVLGALSVFGSIDQMGSSDIARAVSLTQAIATGVATILMASIFYGFKVVINLLEKGKTNNQNNK